MPSKSRVLPTAIVAAALVGSAGCVSGGATEPASPARPAAAPSRPAPLPLLSRSAAVLNDADHPVPDSVVRSVLAALEDAGCTITRGPEADIVVRCRSQTIEGTLDEILVASGHTVLTAMMAPPDWGSDLARSTSWGAVVEVLLAAPAERSDAPPPLRRVAIYVGDPDDARFPRSDLRRLEQILGAWAARYPQEPGA